MPHRSRRLGPSRAGTLAAGLAILLAAVPLGLAAPPATAGNAPEAIDYPEFTGKPDPVPAEPAAFTPGRTMRAMYQADAAQGNGTDFWMDRMLARRGADPSGDWLWTRGRAVFMKEHDPSVIGFGGQLAYWESIDNRAGYTVTIGSEQFTEDVAERVQKPSYWRSRYDNGGALSLTVTKFVTHNNVAVTQLALTNTGSSARTVELSAESPYTKTPEADELTGVASARNNLTTLFPRLSGDGWTVDGDTLRTSLRIGAGKTTTTKVQLGLLTEELPASRQEYRRYREYAPSEAFRSHVRTYNKWWAVNLPYFDLPDENIEKTLYYRWWLMRFNFLDADIPGNDYQFPTSVEGALGYNNAIDLTIGMFVDDLKYLRDPLYSYGPWISAGEVASNGKYRDNPGDPENWSTSHTQYLSEAAWRSYQIHGGQPAIIENLARYAEGDAKGQLRDYDSNDNGLLEIDSQAWTGNDADAVSFDYYGRKNERAESAYVYGGAMVAAQAYDLLGKAGKAEAMRAVADKVRNGVLNLLWNDERQLIEHRDLRTGNLIPWKEINNYYPFSVGLMPNQAEYKESFRLWADAAEYPIFPFYTANQKDKAAAADQGKPGSNNFSVINSTVMFRFLSSALRNYPSEHITAEAYKKLLYWNAWAHYIDGDNNWPDQNEFWADWNADSQQIDYRSWIHHTILGATNWTVVEDAMGLRPRSDAKLELSPIDIGWDHFAVDGIDYRGSDLSIVWDAPGDGERHYGNVPEGYSVFVDGRRTFTVDRLVHLVYDPTTHQITFPDGTAETDLGSRAAIDAPHDVVLTDDRAVDILQKAGRDLGPTSDADNLATAAAPSASFTADGTSLAGAADGFTIDKPHWGTAGSTNSKDWYALEFDEPTTADDVKLYFYNDRQADGYTEPAMYSVQYLDGGAWKDVPHQSKDPTYPRSNYNHVRFDPVTTQRLRVLVTHQPGHATALKEIQAFDTGTRSPRPHNAAPYVQAAQDTSARLPGQVRLRGLVEDDGLPSGELTSRWRVVDGPGTAIIENPTAPTTTARFSEGGTYRLELTASDGRRSSTQPVTVTIPPLDDVVNAAPFATATASYTSPWEDVEAVNDGIDPPRSNDDQNTRWGSWPEQGTQWVDLEWDSPTKLDSAEVYFFDDDGGVRLPAAWKLRYWNGDSFVDVPNPSGYDVAKDTYNKVTFDPVRTDRLRMRLESNEASVGILEWRTYPVRPSSIRPVEVSTPVGQLPDLPTTVTLVYADDSTLEAPVFWEPVEPDQVDQGGTTFSIVGLVDGISLAAEATVHVQPESEGHVDEPSMLGRHPAKPVRVAGR